MVVETIRIAGIIPESIVDGPGIRYVVFTQGCPHHCKGCHNPQTHDFEGGTEIAVSTILQQIDENPLIAGVTLSGGEPVCQAKQLIVLCKGVRERKKNIVLYSGYTFEELLMLGQPVRTLLELCDILIDGRFEEDKKSLLLRFRGSANQRILDLHKSLEQGCPVSYPL